MKDLGLCVKPRDSKMLESKGLHLIERKILEEGSLVEGLGREGEI